MKLLLKTATRRRTDLIEYLNGINNWVALSDLAKVLNCSVRTLESDLEFFQQNWSEYFQIQLSKQLGVRLKTVSTSKIENVYAKIMQDSDEFVFLERILREPGKSAEFWMKEFYFSDATFYRFIKKIELTLESRGLHLNRQRFYVTATDERWVRFFYANYFCEAHGIQDWPFPLDFQNINCFVMRIMSDFDINLSDRQINRMSYLLAVTLFRMKHGFMLDDNLLVDEERQLEQIIHASQRTIEQLFAELGLTELPPNWEKEICRTMFHQYYGWDNWEEERRIKNNLAVSLKSLSEKAEIALRADDLDTMVEELTSIYTRKKIYPYFMYNLYDEYQYIANDLFTAYPQFSNMVFAELKRLEKSTSFLWYSSHRHQVAYIMFLYWTDLVFLLELKKVKVRIIVVSDLGANHAKLLADLIHVSFYSKAKIEVNRQSLLFATQEEIDELNQYDIIVANNALPIFAEDKLVVMENLPTIRDFNTLNEKIEADQGKQTVFAGF